MSIRHIIRIALIVAVAVGLTAACSDKSEVGSGVKDVSGGSGKLSLGEETTTTVASAVTAAPAPTAAPTTAKPSVTAPPTTAAPVTAPPTTAAQDTSFHIAINGDNSSTTQFDPSNAAVAAGTVVKFINQDSVNRSVVANDGSFRSPEIPPGGSWSYKASTPGVFNYQDGTRPYAVGRLEVR